MREACFNKRQVSIFKFREWTNIHPAPKKHNSDEIGASRVHEKIQVNPLRGRRQAWLLTSGDGGHNVTAMFFMQTSGQLIQNLIIYPRKRKRKRKKSENKNHDWYLRALLGVKVFISLISGWMVTHFWHGYSTLKYARPTKGKSRTSHSGRST
jgi:hypothetical protein